MLTTAFDEWTAKAAEEAHCKGLFLPPRERYWLPHMGILAACSPRMTISRSKDETRVVIMYSI